MFSLCGRFLISFFLDIFFFLNTLNYFLPFLRCYFLWSLARSTGLLSFDRYVQLSVPLAHSGMKRPLITING